MKKLALFTLLSLTAVSAQANLFGNIFDDFGKWWDNAFEHSGEPVTLSAKEITLNAGVGGTPQVLTITNHSAVRVKVININLSDNLSTGGVKIIRNTCTNAITDTQGKIPQPNSDMVNAKPEGSNTCEITLSAPYGTELADPNGQLTFKYNEIGFDNSMSVGIKVENAN